MYYRCVPLEHTCRHTRADTTVRRCAELKIFTSTSPQKGKAHIVSARATLIEFDSKLNMQVLLLCNPYTCGPRGA